MEVEGEDGGEDEEDEEEEDEACGDTEAEEEPAEMSVDEDGDAHPRKPKLKPRKSQINVDAIAEEQQVVAQYTEQELITMKLKKKFCKEAVRFIDQMEAAAEIVVKLLGSKNKAEVLEAIEFFKNAHNYGLKNAEVRHSAFWNASEVCS